MKREEKIKQEVLREVNKMFLGERKRRRKPIVCARCGMPMDEEFVGTGLGKDAKVYCGRCWREKLEGGG